MSNEPNQIRKENVCDKIDIMYGISSEQKDEKRQIKHTRRYTNAKQKHLLY